MKECRSNASQRRSANSVAAWIPRRSVAAPTASQRRCVAASQRQQRRSVDPASQRRSANSVAASLPRRSVAAPTASQRHWPNGSVAASQRRSATRPPERRSVAAPPAPGSVTAQRREPTFRPPLPLHWKFRSLHFKKPKGNRNQEAEKTKVIIVIKASKPKPSFLLFLFLPSFLASLLPFVLHVLTNFN